MLLLLLLAVVTRSADDDPSLNLETLAQRRRYFLNNTPNSGDIQRMLSVDHPEMFACTSPLVSRHALAQGAQLPQLIHIPELLLSIAAGCDTLPELTVASQWEQVLHEISASESEFRSRFPLLRSQELPAVDYDPRELGRRGQPGSFSWGTEGSSDWLLHRAFGLGHFNETVVHKAARGGHAALLRWCVQHGARLNEEAGLCRTPLHLAAAAGQACAVRELLTAGADPLAQGSKDDATPLHYAARGGSLEAVRMLVDAVRAAGHSPMSTDHYGSTPADLADAGAWQPGSTWETKDHNEIGEVTDAHRTIGQFLRMA